MGISRPIWNGSISFGLINIPVALYSAEKPSKLHFHLLDKRNNARIQYERINESTGKKVAWDDIVKAYEFEKGNYVIVDEKELEKTAYENYETFDIESFVDQNAIELIYFDKPYFLFPNKQGEKGYHLLREVLENTKKVAIGKVIIKTRQHLCALSAYKNVLLLSVLKFNQELKNPEEIKSLKSVEKKYKITEREISMAEKLVSNMTDKWNPKKYRDENRELLVKWIENKVKKKSQVSSPVKAPKKHPGKVVDFMQLLKKSLDKKEKLKRRA